MVVPQYDGYFQVGSVLYPLPLGSNTLQDIDPVIYRIAQFYKGILPIHLGSRWNQAVTLIGRTDLLNIDWINVGQALHYAVPPLKSQSQFRFPLLYIFREKEKFQHLSIPKYEANVTIQVVFALPPLTVEQIDVMDPLLKAVRDILLDRTFVGYDSNFNNGELVWGESGLELIRIIGCQYGQMPSLKGDIECRSINITLEVHEERKIYLPQYPNMTSIDLDIQYGSIDGYPTGVIDNFIATNINLPCEIVSISPNNASSSGGSIVNIFGQGFTATTGVSINGIIVNNFIVKTQSLIQCTLPPGNIGTGNVVVVATSGTGFLQNGFTYT